MKHKALTYRLIARALALAAMLVVAACGSDDTTDGGTPNVENEAVEFTANVPLFTTRSVINSTSDLQSSGFGVIAYYTENTPWSTAAATATPNFMYNQQVTYSSDKWTYSPVKYWPNDNNPADKAGATGSQAHSYVSFFAYAPYNGEGITLSAPTATGAPTVTYTWGRDRDLLHDRKTDCYKTMDKNYGTVSGRVPFVFYHALALVEFKVRRMYPPGSDITLNSIHITSNGYTGGTFNLATGEWTATTGNDAEPLPEISPVLSVTEYTDAASHLLGQSLMMPQAPVTLTYTLSYTIGSRELTSTSTLSATLKKNNKYTVIFNIDDIVESYLLRTDEAEQW